MSETLTSGATGASEVENLAPEGIIYKTKQAFQQAKVGFVEGRILVNQRVHFALRVKLNKLEDEYPLLKADAPTEWGTLPLEVLDKWAELADRKYLVESVLESLEHEKGQLIGQLNTWIKMQDHYGKEMDEHWENYQDKLRTIITEKKRKQGKAADHSVESETLLRSLEPFDNREAQITYYRHMIALVGDRSYKGNQA